jgi:hypothetical protein
MKGGGTRTLLLLEWPGTLGFTDELRHSSRYHNPAPHRAILRDPTISTLLIGGPP